MVDPERLKSARQMVDRVLKGELTPDTHPHLWDDDVVYINVGIVEQNDVDWLLGQVGKKTFSTDARLLVARSMSGPQQKKAVTLAEAK